MKKPNIVMIVTDQQRCDSIRAYGDNPYGLKVKTDNLDRLAKEGMIFDNAFTGCPLCSPTRTSFITGTYPHTHKTMTNTNLHPLENAIKPKDDVLFHGLKRAGYQIGYVGKWHVNNDLTPADFGCDRYIGLGDYMNYRKENGISIPDEFFRYEIPTGATDTCELKDSRPVYLTDRAIEFIEDYAENYEEPFCVRLDFHGPHFPNVVPEPYASMYDPKDIEPIPSYYDNLSNKPAVQKIKTKHWGTDKFTWQDWQQIAAKYFGEITLIDDQVGRVLDAIDSLGIKDNTIVIFTADHGDLMGAHNIFDKAYTMYDDNTKVPFIMRWPNEIKAGKRCKDFITHSVDLLPTLFEVAGLDIPSEAQGESIVPLMKELPNNRKNYSIGEFHGSHMGFHTMRMVRTEKYKYIFHSTDVDELYDMVNDPYEMKNLIDCAEYREVIKDLRVKLLDWMAETKDHLYNTYFVLYLTGDIELAHKAPGRHNAKW